MINKSDLPGGLIFAGTSISHEEASKILDATYWPPISRGDMERAVQHGYRIIGIIDGFFFSRAAVAHKEIIKAMQEGITVVGGCSMGALRASELDVHGMIGVGKIYRCYRDGIIEDDDEVAVATNPDTFEPVSNPMVNIRQTLKTASDSGIISKSECGQITDLAKKTHYTERSYFGITRQAARNGIIPQDRAENLLKFCNENERDVKREDALLVLEKVKELLNG